MRNLKIPAFLLAAVVSGFSAVFASTHIHTLGVAPVLGVSESTPELRRKFANNPGTVREAARQIGLSKAEYTAFMTKFNNEKPYWGQVPRHLDAMAWAAGGKVYAIHDVVIPAGVNGWEVDLRKPNELVKIYIPMICGNLSVVRVPIRHVSARPPLPVPFVAPPAPAPVPLVAAEVPPPAQQIPPVAPAVHHPKLFWPIAAAVVAGVLIASNHHHDSGPGQVPPVVSGGSSVIPGSSGGGMIGIITPPSNNHGGCGCK